MPKVLKNGRKSVVPPRIPARILFIPWERRQTPAGSRNVALEKSEMHREISEAAPELGFVPIPKFPGQGGTAGKGHPGGSRGSVSPSPIGILSFGS